MIVSRILFSFLSLGAISAVATPTPVVVSDEKRAIEKRADVSDISGVISTLRSNTNSILPQIDNLVSANQQTEDNISPLLQQLLTALTTAGTQINSFQSANQLAPVISPKQLRGCKPYRLRPLIASFGFDAALNTILVGLEILLQGVVQLLAALLRDLSALRTNLGFSLTEITLGLLSAL
ncbi:hypothetical protein M422DRAFT_273066 [Sphaerobolus stellatus SS14]|uniref:Uncharacterized protein n=1 Tax=Sphaerobolus stellatus (strain SS14) TaxID=990650 RepID=A0A0C9TA68_SPHS4|nr:hypothetical protein M422DRAFT_273066 [Sphaerobolus stellatus SS14]